MVDFNEVYNNLNSVDNSFYAGLFVISAAVLGTGVLFYFGNKYCLKDSKDEKKEKLEKKVKE